MYNKGRNPRGARPRPMMPSHSYGADTRRQIHKPQGMHPALKAALLLMIPIAIMQVLNAYVLDILPIYLYPIQLICYMVGGWLAARFFAETLRFVRPRNLRDQCVKLGATAGITLGIINLVFSILFAIILDATEWGTFFGTLTSTFLICAPIDILFGLLLGALGGKLFDHNWR